MSKNLLPMLTLLLLSGCGLFSGSDDTEQPAELRRINEEARLTRLWRVNVGDGLDGTHSNLSPAISGEHIYAASFNGTVVAVDKASGNLRWRARTRHAITGGVGVGGGLVFFGTRNARVVALDQLTGNEVWNVGVTSEVLAAPQSDGQVVMVQTIDGKLLALEAVDGSRRWIYESTVPPLTLRGSSKPLLAGNLVVAGFSNGMISAIDTSNGFLRWEERVAVPQGRYDIERIIDVDGDLLLEGGVVFASSYQGNLMGFDLQSGRIVWGMAASSYHGLALGFGNIYYVTDRSHVVAIRNNTDQIAWENDQLRLRRITAPTTFGNYVAVGDFEGYVHLLSQIDGHFVGRMRLDGSGITTTLQAESGVLYAYTNNGQLTALTLR